MKARHEIDQVVITDPKGNVTMLSQDEAIEFAQEILDAAGQIIPDDAR